MENSHSGVRERLRYLLDLKNMKIQEFSDYIGVPKGTFEKYLNSNRLPSAEFLSALYSKMRVSAQWLLDGIQPMYLLDPSELDEFGIEAPYNSSILGPGELSKRSENTKTYEFVPIQRYDVSASAGHGAQIDEDELDTGWYAFNKKWLDKRSLKPNNLSVISVRGDSMEPKFSDKDLVLLDHSQNLPEDGFIYAVNYDNALYIKAIQRAPHDTLNLVSSNKEYPPISINLAKEADSVRVVGRVVASMHEW